MIGYQDGNIGFAPNLYSESDVSDPNDNNYPDKTLLIILIVFASLVVIIVTVSVVIYFRNKKRLQKRNTQEEPNLSNDQLLS